MSPSNSRKNLSDQNWRFVCETEVDTWLLFITPGALVHLNINGYCRRMWDVPVDGNRNLENSYLCPNLGVFDQNAPQRV